MKPLIVELFLDHRNYPYLAFDWSYKDIPYALSKKINLKLAEECDQYDINYTIDVVEELLFSRDPTKPDLTGHYSHGYTRYVFFNARQDWLCCHLLPSLSKYLTTLDIQLETKHLPPGVYT